MGRKPCCGKGVIRGAWSAREDEILVNYIKIHGEGKWRDISRRAGLRRCGKSCRLRWLNYLRPDIKRGNITEDEDDLIIRLHKLLGNRWTLIAGRLPGRTDNEIKNYWNTNLSKRVDGDRKFKTSGKPITKPAKDQDVVRPQTKHKVFSPVPVRLTESKVLPLPHHHLSIDHSDHSTEDKTTPTINSSGDGDHNHKSSDFFMDLDIDIGGFLSPRQQKEIYTDFDDDNCYKHGLTGDVNFPIGSGDNGGGVAEAEALQEDDWDLEAIASFLSSEDGRIG